jgi:KipI family sensor histidine kinase inhibitor
MSPTSIRFLTAGDAGLTVELGNAVSPELNDEVLRLDGALAAADIAGIVAVVPTYRSLLIQYDSAVITHEDLIARVRALDWRAAKTAIHRRRLIVPVAYGGAHGIDLDEVARRHQLTTEDVIRLHSSGDYRIYMIGFAPGFAYLGGLPATLHTPRRRDPRAMTPAGSVSIGGIQAAIASLAFPSGWHLLGRTPLRGFDPRREQPFMFRAGDRIRFASISHAEFDRLAELAEAGTLTAELESES